jgi:hypothetical protein
MPERKVTVTIAPGYVGHHHQGREVFPGDEIEVWESQIEWLKKIGAIVTRTAANKRGSPYRAPAKEEGADESVPDIHVDPDEIPD